MSCPTPMTDCPAEHECLSPGGPYPTLAIDRTQIPSPSCQVSVSRFCSFKGFLRVPRALVQMGTCPTVVSVVGVGGRQTWVWIFASLMLSSVTWGQVPESCELAVGHSPASLRLTPQVSVEASPTLPPAWGSLCSSCPRLRASHWPWSPVGDTSALFGQFPLVHWPALP